MTTLARFRWPLLALVGAAVIAGAWLSSRSDGPGGDQTVVRGELGPTPGPNADGYIAEKKAYLQDVASSRPSDETAALVSFARQLPASRVAALLDGGSVDHAFVVFPGGEPEDLATPLGVEEAIAERANALQDARRAEAAALRERAATASPAQRPALERDAAESERRVAEIVPGCACVYAVVVRGLTLQRLAQVASDADVRLADVPRPPVSDVRGWLLTPLLPVP